MTETGARWSTLLLPLHQVTLDYVHEPVFLGGEQKAEIGGVGGACHTTRAQLAKAAEIAQVVQGATASIPYSL